MTTTTPDPIGIPAEPPRPSTRFRFAIAFVVGLVAALALGVGALYAYDQQYAYTTLWRRDVAQFATVPAIPVAYVTNLQSTTTPNAIGAYIGVGAVCAISNQGQITSHIFMGVSIGDFADNMRFPIMRQSEEMEFYRVKYPTSTRVSSWFGINVTTISQPAAGTTPAIRSADGVF